MAEIAGVVARIEWSYYTAAAINGYRILRDPLSREWRVTGHIVEFDAFKLAQRPLWFVAPHKSGAWRFPILDPIPSARGPFTVRVGRPFEIGTPDVLMVR